MSSITIIKGAAYDKVTIVNEEGAQTVDLSGVDYHKKARFLRSLVEWGLNGYRGAPPTIG